MAESVIQELEQAAQIVLAPNVVSQEQRHAAENVFLQFRKSKMPYGICREIMERSQNPYVLFQVATTIKECVVREWSLLQPSDTDSLRTFLLHFVTSNLHIQNYVREQILQAVAVIFKRGTLDGGATDRDGLFNDITGLISSGDMSMQLVACSILTALLNEYSSTSRSSSVGLTWEFHSRCKMEFEQKDLKRVFVFCLQVLYELEKVSSPMERDVTTVFNRFLSITEQVLGWEFLPRHLPRKFVGSFLLNQNVSFKPPPSWRDMVLDKGLLDFMFRLHRKIRYNSEMAHHSLQCLAQLASLNGAIFPDDKAKVAYLSSYLQGFLGLISSTQLQDYEASGISNIINCLVIFFPVGQFLTLPKDLLEAFLQNLTKLTTTFGRAAAMEEALNKDDTLYMEAYEKSLDSWMMFLTDAKSLPKAALKQHSIEIFNTYLQCHLSPPDGTRNQVVSSVLDEYDEVEEDDRDRFKDQLCSMGLFARQVPEHAVPLLTSLLEDRVSRLYGQLQRMMQHGVDPANTSATDNSILNGINEDLHWLMLVSGSVLTDESEGETPMIPATLMQYSISQSEKVDMQTTLKVLASPGNEAHTILGSDSMDTVIRLISAILRLCEVEKRAVAAHLTCHLSPQVSGSTMWVLRRWVTSYLLPSENLYSQVSLALVTAFGKETEGAQWMVSYLADKVVDNLHAWASEVALITDTLHLLVALVEKRERGDYVIKCPSIWKLAREVAANETPFNTLPAQSQRHLFKALVLTGSACIDNSVKEEQLKNKRSIKGRPSLLRMLSAKRHLIIAANQASQSNVDTSNPGVELMMLVFGAVQRRFEAAVGRPDLKTVFGEEYVKQDVLIVLECLCGVAEATRANSAAVTFDFVHILLSQCAPLIDLYHNYDDVVQLILDLLNTVANRQICYLNTSHTKKMYNCCLEVIQVYAKHNRGPRITTADCEEERFADILTLMELLTNLLSKDFIDFAIAEDGANGDVEQVSAADVVLYGLDIIVPLMNIELLKFPALCTSYFRLVAYMGEIHPEKCIQLPPQLSKSLMASIDLGLSSFGPDTTKLCLEYLSSIATHVHHSEPSVITSPPQVALAHFLDVVFKMLLLETFDMDLLETASTTFFTLICCNKDRYKELVNELLAQQMDQTYYDRLVKAFTDLTPPSLHLTITRPNRIAFMANFDRFIINVRGFLVIK